MDRKKNPASSSKKNPASSSRKSEMPMRQSMCASATTPQSKGSQPSYGRLTMNKPQSGTSERKTTFFGARASGVGLNRKSSIGGHRNSLFGGLGMSDKMKDPRPLHDKSYIQQCVRKLCEFLTENGYPGGASTNTLQAPSTKEFLKVFAFIYQMVEPTFEIPKSKVEEEVPRLLRELGYTVPLSKSSMYSVGAPHTWPQVLAAVMWLIDTVKLAGSLESESMLFPLGFSDDVGTEESVECNKLRCGFIVDTYAKFMTGADVFEEEDGVFLSELKKSYIVDEAQLASMEQNYSSWSAQVEELEKNKQLDPLMNKKIEKEKLEMELKSLYTYHSQLVAFKTSLESQDSTLAVELKAAGNHLDSLAREQARLKNLLANQTYTPADIERLNREKMELQQKVSSLTKAQEEAEQHAWREEMGLATIKERVEMKVAEYHKMARKLMLIPASAENACGRDFDIQTSAMYQPGAMVHYKAQIQLPLKKMIADMETEGEKKANKKLGLQESNDEINGQILQKTKELKLLREQTHKVDLQLEHDMQDMLLEEQKWSTEKESVEKHLKVLENKFHNGVDEAVQKQKTTRQQLHLVQLETTEERRTVYNNMATIFTHAAEHLAILEKSVEDQKRRLKHVMSMEDHQDHFQQIKDMIDSFKEKANWI